MIPRLNKPWTNGFEDETNIKNECTTASQTILCVANLSQIEATIGVQTGEGVSIIIMLATEVHLLRLVKVTITTVACAIQNFTSELTVDFPGFLPH